MTQQSHSSYLTIDELFSLAPIDEIKEHDLLNFSFDLNHLKKISKNARIKLNECSTYNQLL
jgi:hypothetical protein